MLTMSQPEQTLEFTYQHRIRSGFGMMFIHQFIANIFFAPVLLAVLLLPRQDIVLTLCIVLLFCIALFVLYAVFFCERPNRKLYINRHAFILTITHALGTKECRINADGAEVHTVHLGFFERLFTFDYYKIVTAYHIEVSQIGESFLFPCVDEAEQRQIIARIKDFGVGDVRL